MSSIDKWERGRLKVFASHEPWGRQLVSEADYRAIGGGWAVRDEDLVAEIEGPGFHGIRLEFEVRDERLQCVGVRSVEGGSEITHTVLRKVASAITSVAREGFEGWVVRLVEIDGHVAGLLPTGELGPGRPVVVEGDVAREEFARRHRRGRPPKDPEHLAKVAQLYTDAQRLGQPRVAFIAQQFPGYSSETIRNWIRLARQRDLLAPVNRKPKGDTHGKTA